MISVKSNLLAMNADRQLGINTKKNTKITEKLSSGYKINRAADDAAGLAISEKMRRQIRGLSQGAENIKDGIGYVQTAEGALNEVHDMLQRINELSVKAANGTWTEEDRSYIDSEVQALKKEIDRIFDTTSFNEQKIWEVEKSREIVGQRPENVVKFNSSTTYFDVTDENFDVIAKGSYKINADKDGITVSWTGYNEKAYETDTITWEDLEKNNYSFEISDYFKATDTDLISPTTGEKLFKHKVSMSVNNAVKSDKLKDEVRDEIIKAINGPSNNGTTLYQSLRIPISGRLEDVGGNDTLKKWDTGSNVTFHDGYISYTAAYESHTNSTDGYDYDTAKDGFIEPTINGATNLQCPSADNEKWTFSFYMEGIGEVTAESSSLSFTANDTTGTEDIWWEWHDPPGGTRHKDGISYGISGGTLGNVKSALSPGSANGLLNKSTYGAANVSGSITLSFTLKSGGTTIGGIATTIPVKCGTNAETTQNVLDRINDVFNENTILDIFTSDGNVKNTSNYIQTWSTDWKGSVDVDVYGDNFLYGGVKSFFVQAGAEAGQHIDIEYDALNIIIIGMENTNTLTQEDAGNAINEVKAAMEIVSKQRSDFGAYQNRLEHAYNINNNTVENTQAAESLIRDADIADLMMEYSVNNILMQAGVSMLTQANQLPNSVLELLNA